LETDDHEAGRELDKHVATAPRFDLLRATLFDNGCSAEEMLRPIFERTLLASCDCLEDAENLNSHERTVFSDVFWGSKCGIRELNGFHILVAGVL
jgi:hypothetical protein